DRHHGLTAKHRDEMETRLAALGAEAVRAFAGRGPYADTLGFDAAALAAPLHDTLAARADELLLCADKCACARKHGAAAARLAYASAAGGGGAAAPGAQAPQSEAELVEALVSGDAAFTHDALFAAPLPPLDYVGDKASLPPLEYVGDEAPLPPLEDVGDEAPLPPLEYVGDEALLPPLERVGEDADALPPLEYVGDEAPLPPLEYVGDEAPPPPLEYVGDEPPPPAPE